MHPVLGGNYCQLREDTVNRKVTFFSVPSCRYQCPLTNVWQIAIDFALS
jgi:hypothetical protein